MTIPPGLPSVFDRLSAGNESRLRTFGARNRATDQLSLVDNSQMSAGQVFQHSPDATQSGMQVAFGFTPPQAQDHIALFAEQPVADDVG